MQTEMQNKIRPLTKRKNSGDLYARLPKTEAQITKLLNADRDKILQMAKNADHKSNDYLLNETIVYFLREATKQNDQQLIETLYSVLNLRIIKTLLKFRNKLNNPADFDELIQETELKIITKVFDTETNRADFAEVLFTDFVLSEAKMIWIKLFKKIHKDNDYLIYVSKESSDDRNNYQNDYESNETSNEDILILQESIKKLPSDTQQIISLLNDGFKIESKKTDEITISKILGITSRTIRNRLTDAREKLADFAGDF